MFLVSSCATDIVDLMGGINGVVKDANDGHVISNCQITKSPGGGSAVTSSDGMYQFSNLEAGSYTLSFRKGGYEDLAKSVNVVAGQTTQADVLLTPKSPFELSESYLDFGDVTTSMTLNAYNYSDQVSKYSVSNIPAWATFSPSEGSISPNDNASIVVTVNRDAVSEGNYSQDVIFTYGNSKKLTVKLSMKKVKLSEPTVSIGENGHDITENGFSINGEIVATGGSQITQYGHCWSDHREPTITDNIGKTQLGNTTQTCSFTSNINGLKPETTYYVRSYATNAQGTSYSKEVQITTKEETVAPITLNVSPTTCTLLSVGSETAITVTCDGEWKVQPKDTWVSCSKTSGKGNGSFVVSAKANENEQARNTSVVVSCGNKERTISVSQNGAPNVSKESCSFKSAGGQQDITITSDATWSARSNASWITLSKSNGNGTQTITMTIAPNTSSENRSSTVIVSIGNITKTISVTQNGGSSVSIDGYEPDQAYSQKRRK